MADFMKAIIEQQELEQAVEINYENLLKLKEVCLHASALPWNYDDSPDCQRIFNNPIQTYKLNGEILKFFGHGLQLAKIPKAGTPYAEYWFEEYDMKFIMEASKWMLPLVNELLKKYEKIEQPEHMPYTTVMVANSLIKRFKESYETLTAVQLQRLLYFAYGWHLSIFNKPICTESVRVGKDGPMFDSIYYELLPVASSVIDTYIVSTSITPEFLPSTLDAFVNRIYNVYGRYTIDELTAMTHQDTAPWKMALQSKCNFIENDAMKKWFIDVVLKKNKELI